MTCIIVIFDSFTNASIRELRSASIMDCVRHDLFDFLGEALLQRLWDFGVTGGMRDLAGLGVGTGVV